MQQDLKETEKRKDDNWRLKLKDIEQQILDIQKINAKNEIIFEFQGFIKDKLKKYEVA